MSAPRLLVGAAAVLAVAAVLTVVTFEARGYDSPVMLSESKALALAEGKISASEKLKIAQGGIGPSDGATASLAAKHNKLRKLVKDAEQKEAMVTLQAYKLQEAQEALHRALARPAKLRRELDAGFGKAADINGGDHLVSVRSIEKEDVAQPAPITRSDASGRQHFLSSAFRRPAMASSRSKTAEADVRAFLDSNGYMRSARAEVSKGHVGDELVVGGDERVAAGRADSHARNSGIGSLMHAVGLPSGLQRARATLSKTGVNVDAEPWQARGGALF